MAIITDGNDGTYHLWQNGDLWLIPTGMEWSDEADDWVWPTEEEVLKVTKTDKADYRYRTVVKRADVERKLALQINSICYSNFKDSVKDRKLHDAYLKVWRTMLELQQ